MTGYGREGFAMQKVHARNQQKQKQIQRCVHYALDVLVKIFRVELFYTTCAVTQEKWHFFNKLKNWYVFCMALLGLKIVRV